MKKDNQKNNSKASKANKANKANKAGKANKARQSLDFDSEKDSLFRVSVEVSPSDTRTFEFTSSPGGENLTYDEVFDDASAAMERELPPEYYPKAEVGKIEAFCGETGEWYEAVPEGDASALERLRRSGCRGYLVLPEAVYSLSKEMKLAFALEAEGIVDDALEQDMKAMRRVL